MNDQFLNILGLFRLNAFLAPFYMEPSSTAVFEYCREARIWHNPDDLCRPDLDFNYAFWPAPPAPPWWWHIWTDPHPLETGMFVVLFGGDAFN